MYKAVCDSCEKLYRQDESQPPQGRHVGETYRMVYERADEHAKVLRRFYHKSLMVKHWDNVHFEQNYDPQFPFKVIKKHFDPLSR